MIVTQDSKWRSLRFRLPMLVLLLAIGGGLVLYVLELRNRNAEFEAEFSRNQTRQALQIQTDTERWVQRNDLDMVQTVFAELGLVTELKSALFLDATNTVLAATRREYLGQPLDVKHLGLDQLDSGELIAAIETAGRTMRGTSLFTTDRNGLILCLPTSLPLRPGELELSRRGVILVSSDLRLEKAANLRRLQADFLTYFAVSLIIALTLGISLHFLITRRLEWLESAMTDFASGKPVGEAPARLGDEICHLVRQFNGMATTLTREMDERRRMEEAMRKSAKDIQDLYDHAPCGYHSLDGSGTFVRINDTELSWLGYTREEIVGKVKFADLLTPQSLDRFHREFPVFKERGFANDLDFELVRKDGTILPVALNATAIKDAHGHFVMSRSVVHDVTEHKRAEEAVQKLHRYTRSLIEASLDPLVTISPSGKITDVNMATELVTGRTRAELTGTDFSDYFTEPEKARAGYEQAFREGSVRDYPLELRHRDGRVTSVLYNATVYRDESGGAVGVFAAARDMTERKLAEETVRRFNAELEHRVEARTQQLAEANKELVEFSYSISHDLRTPLRSIDGFSRVLLADYSDKLDAEGKENLRTIRAASQKMGILLDDMVRLLQINRSEMRRVEVNLSQMAEQAADELKKAEPERNVEFVIAPDCVVCGDAALLRIAVENILGNAWKYTSGKGSAKIEFGITQTIEGPAYFVRDNGCGFDMKHAHKLFGAFQRLHHPSEFPGTGAGLAGVQRVIRRHGGQVWIEGKLNEGATLYFTLPNTN